VWAKTNIGKSNMGKSQYGQKPIWAKANMGKSQYVQKLVWAKATMGKSKYGQKLQKPISISIQFRQAAGGAGAGEVAAAVGHKGAAVGAGRPEELAADLLGMVV
ncbi:MAG: hypothetical protein NZ697_00010, partial [Porticoccaceae bacterium]|nr:hypothetical protein [Porticoccaceae bacterium]